MALEISDREKKLVLTAAGFAVFYVFYSFFLNPMLTERGMLKNRLSSAKTELALMESKIKALESIEKEMTETKAKNAAVVPRGEMSLEVLKRLAETTASSDLTLLRLKPLEEKASSGGVKFEVNCAGSYEELNDFLKGLFGLEDVVMMVEQMTIKGGGLPAPQLDIGLQVTSYF